MRDAPADVPIPASLGRFLELYEAGRFWDSHEALEHDWHRTGSDFLQGLILYASAWVHWERGNAHGVKAQLSKALDRLSAYPSRYLGIDVAGLRDHCASARRDVVENPDDWSERIRPQALDFSRSRLRGDETELCI